MIKGVLNIYFIIFSTIHKYYITFSLLVNQNFNLYIQKMLIYSDIKKNSRTLNVLKK